MTRIATSAASKTSAHKPAAAGRATSKGKSAASRKAGAASKSKASAKSTAAASRGTRAPVDSASVGAPRAASKSSKATAPTVTETFGAVKTKLDALTNSLGSLPAAQRDALVDSYCAGKRGELPAALAGPNHEVEQTLAAIGKDLDGLKAADRATVLGLMGVTGVEQLVAKVASSLGMPKPGGAAQGLADPLFGTGPAADAVAGSFSWGSSYEKTREQFEGKGLKEEDINMMTLQEEQQRYQRLLTLLTQLLQMKHEGLKSIEQNLRA